VQRRRTAAARHRTASHRIASHRIASHRIASVPIRLLWRCCQDVWLVAVYAAWLSHQRWTVPTGLGADAAVTRSAVPARCATWRVALRGWRVARRCQLADVAARD
jgi:hypothetical protein